MWIERALGPLPGEKEARAFGICGIGVALIACALSLYYGFKGETFLGRPLGGDFVQFYAAGRILNLHQPAKLFDIPYLAEMEHSSLPTMPRTQMLIFGNAPAVAAIFRPLAWFSYEQAYCIWLAFSAAVYIAGMLLIARRDTVAILLALGTPMFTLETWIGGQISIFAFLTFALFVRMFREQRYFLAGFALGFAAYKPSLVAIPAALFLFGRCWKMLGGLAVSASLIGLASLGTVGFEGMRLWLATLRVFRYLATDRESVLRRSKYVDLNSFLTGLFGPHPVVSAMGYVIVASALIVLAWGWYRRGPGKMLWTATVSATLVLNVYVPVYDTIILIPALMLVPRTREFHAWMLALCLVPWLTQSAADFLHLQLLTIVLGGFSYWAFTRPDCERPAHSLR